MYFKYSKTSIHPYIIQISTGTPRPRGVGFETIPLPLLELQTYLKDARTIVFELFSTRSDSPSQTCWSRAMNTCVFTFPSTNRVSSEGKVNISWSTSEA